MPDEATIEKMEEVTKEQRRMRTLFQIAVDIKAERLPASYSEKGAELAEKYSGEELEEMAWGS